jgi:hypothetical protein
MLPHIGADAIRQAVKEWDEIGQEAFLKKYGFGRARQYFLLINGKEYASKAIVGRAYGYQFPDQDPLRSSDFTGGRNTVQRLLESLGFTVMVH